MSKRTRLARYRRSPSVIAQPLEPRLLFATLSVTGTAGPDAITVSVPGDGQIHVIIGGATALFSDAAYDRIEIDTGGGGDDVRIYGNGDDYVLVRAGADDDFVYVTGRTSGSLDGNVAYVEIDCGAGSNDSVTIDDAANPFDDTYSISGVFCSRNVGGDGIVYSGADLIDLQGGSGASTFYAGLTSAAQSVLVRGGGGDDTLQLYSAPLFDSYLSRYQGSIDFLGEGGSDTVWIEDGEDSAGKQFRIGAGPSDFFPAAITSPTFAGVAFGDVESVRINAGTGNDRLTAAASGPYQLALNGSGGDDEFRIGEGSLDSLASPITVDGGSGGFDQIILNDAMLSQNDNYVVSPTTVTRPFFGGLTYANAEFLRLLAETGENTVTVTGTSCQVLVNGGGAGDTIDVGETSSGAPVYVEPSAGLDTVSVNPDGTGTALAIFQSTVHLKHLFAFTGGEARAEAGGLLVLVTQGLTISGSGLVNLNDNDMILDYGAGFPQLVAVQNLIKAARNGGLWTGAGITSSTARGNPLHNTTLGAMEATDYQSFYGPSATFDGEPIDSSAVLVKYTYNGDANFDGRVTFDDYVRTDTGFNAHRTGWSNGDFNYDGVVNFDDYVMIDTAFNSQGAPLGRLPRPANVRRGFAEGRD